jgi:AraC-like DNA-binding protein
LQRGRTRHVECAADHDRAGDRNPAVEGREPIERCRAGDAERAADRGVGGDANRVQGGGAAGAHGAESRVAGDAQGAADRGVGGDTDQETVCEYIEANLSRDITLTELAELAGLSRFHFARSFRRSMGLPPHRYLLQQRIERAKELLAPGTLPVGEIAAGVGFSGATSLARTFLRVTGTTLKEFVRRI